MNTQIKSRFEPVSDRDVFSLEEKIKTRLPEDYRNFILDFNGGFPTPNIFYISPYQQESRLSIFYGITSKKSCDIWANALNSYEDMGRSFLPIGEDPGGNQIYISLHPDTLGRIYFRDHELYASESLTLIANSFSEFLQNLYATTRFSD